MRKTKNLEQIKIRNRTADTSENEILSLCWCKLDQVFQRENNRRRLGQKTEAIISAILKSFYSLKIS
jgi:hypothetical protein